MEDACLLAAWLALMAALVAVGPPYVALLAPVHNERDEWQARRPEDRFEVVVGEHLMTADGASARKRREDPRARKRKPAALDLSSRHALDDMRPGGDDDRKRLERDAALRSSREGEPSYRYFTITRKPRRSPLLARRTLGSLRTWSRPKISLSAPLRLLWLMCTSLFTMLANNVRHVLASGSTAISVPCRLDHQGTGHGLASRRTHDDDRQRRPDRLDGNHIGGHDRWCHAKSSTALLGSLNEGIAELDIDDAQVPAGALHDLMEWSARLVPKLHAQLLTVLSERPLHIMTTK